MQPPGSSVAGRKAGPMVAPAVGDSMVTLKKRSDFLRAARAKYKATPGFVLQARKRRPNEPQTDAIRIGYTCSKKVGNAVARNRAKRRLRALARQTLRQWGQSGWDYVLIGRARTTAERPFSTLTQDLKQALKTIHQTPS